LFTVTILWFSALARIRRGGSIDFVTHLQLAVLAVMIFADDRDSRARADSRSQCHLRRDADETFSSCRLRRAGMRRYDACARSDAACSAGGRAVRRDRRRFRHSAANELELGALVHSDLQLSATKLILLTTLEVSGTARAVAERNYAASIGKPVKMR
jgi:hypothetical protein